MLMDFPGGSPGSVPAGLDLVERQGDHNALVIGPPGWGKSWSFWRTDPRGIAAGHRPAAGAGLRSSPPFGPSRIGQALERLRGSDRQTTLD